MKAHINSAQYAMMRISLHKIVANIALLFVYAFFFGKTSFEKFLDNAVIITKDIEHSEQSSPIPQPVFTIFPLNPDYGSNRKLGGYNNTLCSNLTGGEFDDCWKIGDYDTLCAPLRGGQFIECVENVTYSLRDILPYDDSSENKTFEITEFFVSSWWGIAKSVKMVDGVIANNKISPNLRLNESLDYMILITDPKLQLYTASPDVVARSLLTVKERRGIYFFYLQES